MKLLLDTNVFLYTLENSSRLSNAYKKYITDSRNEKWISQFSLMELSIKVKIGKLPNIKVTLDELFRQAVADGFLFLTVTNEQILTYNSIPLFADHRDPFDRFIIAAAIAENMKILTTDKQFQLYTAYVDVL